MATNLLLLDESLLVQRVVELAFRDKDFEVHTAASADEAIAMAENLPPDIVVASVDMQRSDGLGFCRRLRQKPELSRAPLLVLTSARNDISEAEAEEVAAAGSVEKPFKPATFTLEVERIVAAAGAPAPEPDDRADAPEKTPDEEISDEASPASIVEEPSDEDDARREAEESIGQTEDAASGVEEKNIPPEAIRLRHELHRSRDEWEHPIAEFMSGRLSTPMGLAEIARQALDVRPDKLDKATQMRIAECLKNLGFHKERFRLADGSRPVMWTKDSLPPEEKEEPPPSAPPPGLDGEKLDPMIQKALGETLEKILPTLLRRIETIVVARLPDLVEQIVLREIEKIKRGE